MCTNKNKTSNPLQIQKSTPQHILNFGNKDWIPHLHFNTLTKDCLAEIVGISWFIFYVVHLLMQSNIIRHNPIEQLYHESQVYEAYHIQFLLQLCRKCVSYEAIVNVEVW